VPVEKVVSLVRGTPHGLACHSQILDPVWSKNLKHLPAQ